MKNIEKYYDQIKKELEENYDEMSCIVYNITHDGDKCCNMKCSECNKMSLEWMIEEYKEPILTDQEKQALKHICEAMESLGKKVTVIKRYNVIANQIEFYLIEPNDHISLCTDDSLFSGMQAGKEYTPEELGL